MSEDTRDREWKKGRGGREEGGLGKGEKAEGEGEGKEKGEER